MELIIVVLFLGPLLAVIYCHHPVDVPLAWGLGVANLICLGIWGVIFMSLDKVLGHWAAMLVGWVGWITISGVFFWLAMEGTKCGKFAVGLAKELLNRNK